MLDISPSLSGMHLPAKFIILKIPKLYLNAKFSIAIKHHSKNILMEFTSENSN
jgi:hypothetical protein